VVGYFFPVTGARLWKKKLSEREEVAIIDE